MAVLLVNVKEIVYFQQYVMYYTIILNAFSIVSMKLSVGYGIYLFISVNKFLYKSFFIPTKWNIVFLLSCWYQILTIAKRERWYTSQKTFFTDKKKLQFRIVQKTPFFINPAVLEYTCLDIVVVLALIIYICIHCEPFNCWKSIVKPQNK